MPIQLSKDIADRLNEGVDVGGGNQLPFVAPLAFFRNGNAALKELKNAAYYGGWIIKSLDMDETIRAYNMDQHPAEWKQVEISPKEGEPFSGYMTRHVVVAPIAFRSAWKHKDTGVIYPEGGDYVQDTRHVAQALVYAATKVTEGKDVFYQPTFPLVLSVRGYQVTNLKSAFQTWNKYTASARKTYAPGVPAWCFYLAVGTFGTEFKSISVGKGSQKSPITPVVPYLPETITEQTLEVLFVGEGMAGTMADMVEDSKEWVNSWKTPVQDPYHRGTDVGNGPDDPFGEFPDPEGGDNPF